MSRAKKAPAMVHAIHEQLLPLAVAIADLELDPDNAREHGERSVDDIAESLRQFGQRKTVVGQARPDGRIRVRAGNGMVMAATKLGWTHVAVLQVEEGGRAGNSLRPRGQPDRRAE